MSLPFSVNSVNADAVVTYMRNMLGIVLKGDAELHIAGRMPLRVDDAIPAATMAAAIAASSLSAADQATLTAIVAKRKMTK